jgi:hypothetical protein
LLGLDFDRARGDILRVAGSAEDRERWSTMVTDARGWTPEPLRTGAAELAARLLGKAPAAPAQDRPESVLAKELARAGSMTIDELGTVLERVRDCAEPVAVAVPGNINLANLAYNLACYHALRGPKDKLYEAVRHARRLGRSRQQFLNDADFASFVDDPGFLEAIADYRAAGNDPIRRE